MALTMEQVEETLSRILRGVHGHEEVIALHDHLTTLEADRVRMDWLEKNFEQVICINNPTTTRSWSLRGELNDRTIKIRHSLRDITDTAMQSPTQESNQV